jgi:tRNA pseudouridine55 synthase
VSRAGRAAWRKVDGLLLLDKPAGISSNAALQRARRLYQARKAGHTGTLDPLATGLLPLCFGEATKFSVGLLDADKGYLASVRFGHATTTGDAEGDPCEPAGAPPGRAAVEAALPRLRGRIRQVPPMYSALKIGGQPLYRLARAGQSVERSARLVEVGRLELIAWEPPQVMLRIDCSKGTYVRTLADDLGRALGCGAYLTALRRVRVGPLRIEDARSLDWLDGLDDAGRQAALLPPDTLVAHLPALRFAPAEVGRLTSGLAVAPPPGQCAAGPGPFRAYADEPVPRFLGLLEPASGGLLRARRLLAGRADGESA